MSEPVFGSQFMRFCVIGTLGFLVDSGVLLILVALLEVPPLTARAGSFLAASTVTYALNRRFTFRQHRAGSVAQWLLYASTTALGALVNIGTYLGWIALVGVTPPMLVIGVALGSIVALLLNYSISRVLIFRSRV